MKYREEIIADYVDGYNLFDIAKMTADFHQDIRFEHEQGGEVTMTLIGIDAFLAQAKQATTYFRQRTQTIQSLVHDGDVTTVEIGYHAVLAIDLPNGMKAGQEVRLKGKSVFQFSGDKVIALRDIG